MGRGLFIREGMEILSTMPSRNEYVYVTAFAR